jgi:hypothetical protein
VIGSRPCEGIARAGTASESTINGGLSPRIASPRMLPAEIVASPKMLPGA